MVYISLLSVVVLWGSSFAASKVGMQELSPLNLAGMRLSIASVLFGTILLLQQPRIKVDIRDVPALAVAGFMVITSYFYIQYTGLLYTTSINASLLLATSPIWTTLYCVASRQEKVTSKAMLGILTAFLGISLVISKGKWDTLFVSGNIVGDLLLLSNSMVWAGFTLYGKKIMLKYSPFTAIAYIYIFGTLMLLPVILIPNPINPISIFQQFSNVGPSTVIAILYLSVLCSAYGYVMWYRGVARIGAVRTASFQYLAPLSALLAGVWLLDEQLNFTVVVGGVMVVSGVYITNKYKTSVAGR